MELAASLVLAGMEVFAERLVRDPSPDYMLLAAAVLERVDRAQRG